MCTALDLGQKTAGVELLSHTLLCSIIVAVPLNNRVRDGNVCCRTAINTGEKNQAHGIDRRLARKMQEKSGGNARCQESRAKKNPALNYFPIL